jgi:hypothetical protein
VLRLGDVLFVFLMILGFAGFGLGVFGAVLRFFSVKFWFMTCVKLVCT